MHTIRFYHRLFALMFLFALMLVLPANGDGCAPIPLGPGEEGAVDPPPDEPTDPIEPPAPAPFPGPCTETFSAYTEADPDLGSTPDSQITYRYTTEGLLDAKERDDGLDGLVDGATSYSYDVLGRLVDERTEDGEGQLLERVVTGYDPETGRLLFEEIDEDGDFRIDVRVSFLTDEYGSPTLETVDEGADGGTDETRTLAYTYGDDGQVKVVIEQRDSRDGWEEWKTELGYDAAGRLVSKVRTYQPTWPDVKEVEQWDHEYDASGNRTATYYQHQPASGAPARLGAHFFSYRCWQ